MKSEQVKVAEICARQSAAGEIGFGEVVKRLVEAGFERYHADYSRMETTYYTLEGESCIVPMALDHGGPIAREFSAEAVAEGVRQSQRGEIMYPQFTKQALAAGCVGYFVQLTGKCVQYFGRTGEMHVEWFPGAKK